MPYKAIPTQDVSSPLTAYILIVIHSNCKSRDIIWSQY